MKKLDELFDISAQARAAMPTKLILPGTVDTHVHFRTPNDGRMQMVVAACAGEHEATIDVPNVPDVQTLEQYRARRRIIESYQRGARFQVGMTPLINDKTDPDVIRAAWESGDIKGVKIFWQGVSNDYGNSISSAAAIVPLIKALAKPYHNRLTRPVVTLHAECLKDYRGDVIPIKDREFWCVQNEVKAIIEADPEGTYVIRHVSDYRTLEWVELMRHKNGYNIHVELSPQYFILIDDSLFESDSGHAELQCDCIFWPRPKDALSRSKIQEAALWGVSWIHIATDFAIHLDNPLLEGGVKINKWGKAVGGLNLLPKVAKSLMIDFFMSKGRSDLLAPMLSGNAAALYGFELSGKEHAYAREDWVVGDYTHGTVVDEKLGNRPVKAINFLRGHTMHWKLVA